MSKSDQSFENENRETAISNHNLSSNRQKQRRWPLETSVVFVLIVILFLFFFFFCLDYGAAVRRFNLLQASYYVWLHTAPAEVREKTIERCDLGEGEWVWDDTYPLYESRDCKFMDGGFRCLENGRPDISYTKWRWQPKGCNLPRFDGKLMLERLRGKRLVFVGDSIGRNQWESLLCMLSRAVSDPNSIYEVNGSPITKHTGFLSFVFPEYNCSVEYYRSPFLVPQGRAPKDSPPNVRTSLRVDQMDWSSVKWRDADVLVFNTGHWWNFEKTIRTGCYFQQGSEIKLNMSIGDAYKTALHTLLHWIDTELNPDKTQVFFRTYAPVHFSGGNWRHGGGCHLEISPEMGATPRLPAETWPQFSMLNDILRGSDAVESKLGILNVTYMTSARKDGHISLYYRDNRMGPTPIQRQDCSHWCLPGVPDSWNEMLYALLLRKQQLKQ